MLEGKENHILDMLFPFVFRYVDVRTGYADEALLKKLHAQYSDLISDLWSDNYFQKCSAWDLEGLRSRVAELKICTWKFFDNHCDWRLNTLMFQLLDDKVLDIGRIGSMMVFTAPLYDHYNLRINKVSGGASKRIVTQMEGFLCLSRSE